MLIVLGIGEIYPPNPGCYIRQMLLSGLNFRLIPGFVALGDRFRNLKITRLINRSFGGIARITQVSIAMSYEGNHIA